MKKQNLEQGAEKRDRLSDDIMLYVFDSRADSDFRSHRPKIIQLWLDCAAIASDAVAMTNPSIKDSDPTPPNRIRTITSQARQMLA